jgi:hypothetical protein
MEWFWWIRISALAVNIVLPPVLTMSGLSKKRVILKNVDFVSNL